MSTPDTRQWMVLYMMVITGLTIICATILAALGKDPTVIFGLFGVGGIGGFSGWMATVNTKVSHTSEMVNGRFTQMLDMLKQVLERDKDAP